MNQDQNRFRALIELVGNALELPAEEREDYLRANAEGTLLAEALELLHQSDSKIELTQQLEARIAADAAALTREDLGLPSVAPENVGPYHILSKLGEGGMGVVYRARQTEPFVREVALKLIRGGLDSSAIIRRFDSERQVLARMDHPGIALIYEAGATEDGRPWYAMELVDGIPVTEYCDRKQLELGQRLDLFVRICQAVQHAHHKGVIHRDLKPSNVLVTEREGKAHPKVIDFGIAKLTEVPLDDASLLTSEGMLIGTLEYMSPEQARSSPSEVDARSDIYSLGALLYHLVCGQLPIDGARLRRAGFTEALRVLQEEEPPLPSLRLDALGDEATTVATQRGTQVKTLNRRLRGDLDWVVMRALEKDPLRRYQSANDLAEEIGRYLAFEPVLAGPPSRSYRARRFVRRHRVGVIAATAVVLALLCGAIVASVGLVRARSAEERALAEAQTAQATTEFLQDMLASVQPEKAQGEEVPVRAVLEEARRKIDEEGELEGQPVVEAALRYTIGDTYQALGDFEAALPQLLTSLRIYESELPADDPRLQRCIDRIGMVYWMQGDLDRSMEYGERLLQLRQQLYGDEDSRTLDALQNVANTYADMGHLDRAEEILREGLAIDRRLYAREPGEFLCYSTNNLATVLADQKKWDEAIALNQESLALRREFMGENSPAAIISQLNLGFAQRGAGDLEAAEESLTEASERAMEVLGDEHVRTAVAFTNLAAVQAELDNMEQAVESARFALSAMSVSSGPDSYRTGRVHALLGSILLKAGEYTEAEVELSTAYALLAAELGPEDPRTREIAGRLAELHATTGNTPAENEWKIKAEGP